MNQTTKRKTDIHSVLNFCSFKKIHFLLECC